MGAYESGSAFLAGVLAKLPAESRAQVEAALTAAEARDAVVTLGDGVLARSDYSRNLDEIRRQTEALQEQQQQAVDLYNQNLSWWEQHKNVVGEYQRLQQSVAQQPQNQGNVYQQPVQPPAQPTPQPIADVVRAIISDEMSLRERDYAGYAMYTPVLVAQHLHTFGEVIDGNALLADPRVGKPVPGQPGRVFSLQDAYVAKYGDQIEAKRKADEDARINKIVEDRFAERMKSHAQPFPLRAEPSPLDALSQPEAQTLKSDDYLDRAMNTYAALQGSRT